MDKRGKYFRLGDSSTAAVTGIESEKRKRGRSKPGHLEDEGLYSPNSTVTNA